MLLGYVYVASVCFYGILPKSQIKADRRHIIQHGILPGAKKIFEGEGKNAKD